MLDKIRQFFAEKRIPSRLKVMFRPWPKLRRMVSSWPRLIGFTLALFVLLYYPLGALVTHNIDTNTEYEFAKTDARSATIGTMSFLIRREVYSKAWTPALPFIFPAYVLDNMPSFQLGVLSAVKTFATALDADSPADLPLHAAAELLKYPGTIWMFSPTNKLIPAPSSNSQYRRARKQLKDYNQMLLNGEALFDASPQKLRKVLRLTRQELKKTVRALENHIREHSESLFDMQADNVFYNAQGRLYASFLLLKALSYDFKESILYYNLYQNWTSLLKALELASQLNPEVVRNAELDSSFAPNHLAAIGFYAQKAVITLDTLIEGLAQLPAENQK